jgi:hypothetical protein
MDFHEAWYQHYVTGGPLVSFNVLAVSSNDVVSARTYEVRPNFVSQPFPLLPTHSRCRCCLFSLDHTQTHTTVGRTPLDEGSARRRDLYLTTQTLYKTKKFMPPVGFEPTIPASERPQTYTLDRAATGIGETEINTP